MIPGAIWRLPLHRNLCHSTVLERKLPVIVKCLQQSTKAGYIVGKYVSMEMLIEKTKETYYEALQASSTGYVRI